MNSLWNRAVALLRKIVGKFPRPIPTPSLQGAIRIAKQHLTPWLLIGYALVISIGVYTFFIAGAAMRFSLVIGLSIYVLIYVPISFLRKPGWSRFFTRFVPAIIFLTINHISLSTQFEYWVRADEFERDVRVAQAHDPNLTSVKWMSWNYTDAFWKTYFYVVSDQRDFDPQDKPCIDGEAIKLRPHFYVVECDLNKPLKRTE